MIVKRIGPLSFAKITGMLYGIMGLIFGVILSLVSIVGGAFGPDKDAGPMGMLFGAAAVVALPLFYGVLGFVMSLIGAALYNLIAGWVGGSSWTCSSSSNGAATAQTSKRFPGSRVELIVVDRATIRS